METTETFKNDLKIKWPTSKRKEKAVKNPLFNQALKFIMLLLKTMKLLEMNSVNTALKATIDNESYQSHNRKETIISDTHLRWANKQMKVWKTLVLKNKKIFILCLSLLLLFCFCFISMEKIKITYVRIQEILFSQLKTRIKHTHLGIPIHFK